MKYSIAPKTSEHSQTRRDHPVIVSGGRVHGGHRMTDQKHLPYVGQLIQMTTVSSACFSRHVVFEGEPEEVIPC